MVLETIAPWFLSLMAFILGLIFGSFANVLIVRLPKGESLFFPGSACRTCGRFIKWVDNIPILSFLLLRGKCRFCKKSFSLRYPLVELLTALLFLAAQMHWGLTPVLVLRDIPIITFFVAIIFIDIEHRIIPDGLNFSGLALALATCWLDPALGWMSCFLGAALGFLAFYLLAFFYFKLRGKSGLGGGDIKLLALIGAFLGPRGVLFTMLVSSILGTGFGVLMSFFHGEKDLMGMSLPFGPFLVLGALSYYLLGNASWLSFMMPN